LSKPKKPTDTIVIHIHGTSGTFYWNSFYEPLAASATGLGLAYLSTNNRGSNIYELEESFIPHGAALEHFEDCLLDIDAWIELAMKKGYKRIVLEGHSFGTEKAIYYAAKGKYTDVVAAVILLGFSDSYGTQERYLKRTEKNLMPEAQRLMAEGRPCHLLSDLHAQADGAIPASATTYVNFFCPESELSKALPLRNGKELPMVREIHVPILGIIGDEDEEYTIIPIHDAMRLLESENPLTETHQIPKSNHGFEGKENELAAVIADFLKRRVLQ
jgi:pimeloyl-ACP methyl ester carboxylesterase